jgi:hypothetical protein
MSANYDPHSKIMMLMDFPYRSLSASVKPAVFFEKSVKTVITLSMGG